MANLRRSSPTVPLTALLVCLVLAAAPAGQAPAPAPAYVISEASVRAHMEFLAGDALQGRGSGTRDEWLAAAYVASHLRRLGLEPMGDEGGYVQAIEIQRGETTAPPVLVAGATRLVHGDGMLVQAIGSPRLAGPLERYRPDEPATPGAVVLMPEAAAGGPPRPVPAGAVLALLPETPAIRGQWATVAARPVPMAPRIAALPPSAARPGRIVLDANAYAALAALPDGTSVSFEADVRVSTSHTWNAVGRLAGSDPARAGEVILLSAHLDHLGVRGSGPDTIYNGADDDASGSVAVLELAEALARGPRPKRTVVFAWFGSEESGGHGSNYFAELPVVPIERLVANLQFEMIARPDGKVPPQTLWLTGYERSNLGETLARQGARLVADPHPEQNFFIRSDNIRFARKGVVAHTVSSFGLHPEYHRPSDELRFVDFAHMTEAIRSLVEPVRWLAESSFRPEWAPNGRPR